MGSKADVYQRKVLEFEVSKFFEFGERGLISSLELEGKVVETLSHEFLFSNECSKSLFRVCFWVLCNSDGTGAFEQTINPDEKEVNLYLVLKRNRTQIDYVQKVMEKYGEDFLIRLEKGYKKQG